MIWPKFGQSARLAVHLDVPLVVDAGQGASWAAAH